MNKWIAPCLALLAIIAVPAVANAGTADQPFLFALDDSSAGFAGTLADGTTLNESAIGLHIPGAPPGTNFELWADDSVVPFRGLNGVSIDSNNGDIYITFGGGDRTSLGAGWNKIWPLALNQDIESGDILRLTNYTVDALTGKITGGDMDKAVFDFDLWALDGENIDAFHLLPNGNFLVSTSTTADFKDGANPDITINAEDIIEITPAGAFVGWHVDARDDSDGDPSNDLPSMGSGSFDAIDNVPGTGFVYSASASLGASISTNGIGLNDGETFTLDLGDLSKPYSFDFDMDGLLIGGGAVGQDSGGDLDDLDGLAHLSDTARLALIDALIAGGGNTDSDIIAALIAVPEPNTLALLGMGVLLVVRRRRR